jgi:hypothetical protein
MEKLRIVAAVTGLLTAVALVATPATSVASPPGPARPATLTNLAHLDFLTDTVAPPPQPGHTTYRLDREPAVGVLWVYADHLPAGGYRRTGGGAYDPATNTYGQGSYDADDVSRAAVVYLRHWVRSGDRHSRDQAYQLLRGLTYLQTATGPNAGNVVLWMQPDGTLNPSPTPTETPDPSDSGASYWLARTIWALGEGYAAFRAPDPGFAAFLKNRLDLAIAALDRQVLTRYGQYQVVDGLRIPAWLVVDGADASSEAVLGLGAYVRAGGTRAARTALAQLSAGIAEMGRGDADTWPHGAILPWALSRSLWHAWGAQMPTALAEAAITLREPSRLRPAVADAAVFTPHLLTATGPVNGWLPVPIDGTQIAYGADARVQALLAVSRAERSIGLRQLAGVAAGWFFGQNPAGATMYDPGTGVTNDGVSADGTVNLNSGAESTIHGLLTMQALDANPDVAVIAHAGGSVVRRDGQRTFEAEAGQLSGPASVVAANPAWTGESQWSGGAYVQVTAGSTVSWTLPPAAQPRLVEAVLNRVPGPGGVSVFDTSEGRLGEIRYGGGGAQGVSAAPGALLPITVPRHLPSGADRLIARTEHGGGQLDALLVTPLVSTLITRGDGRGLALLTSVADTRYQLTITVPGTGPTVASSYDGRGRLTDVVIGQDAITVPVPAGGFAIALR